MTKAQKQWAAVDRYLVSQLIPAKSDLRWVLKTAAAAGLPPISVSPAQGKLLYLTAKAIGAKRILELGTLAGYSTIWMARALPRGGRLVAVELLEKHAKVARRNFSRAGCASAIDLRVGPALDQLKKIHAEKAAPFDFIFIDADKVNYPAYFKWAMKLARPGTVIVADNVVREGAVADSKSTDPAVRAVRRFNRAVAAERRATATVIQTVGAKGYDGLAFVLVTL